MRRWQRASILFLAGVALLGSACRPKKKEGVVWLATMDEGKERATEDGKPLLVYYTADWCKMTEQFEDDTLANATVAEKLRGFVTVKIDADADEETPAAYNVTAFPTTIFYNPDGSEVKRLVGVVPPAAFVKLLDDVLAGRLETVKEMLAREKANPDDLTLAYELGKMYAETGRPGKARRRFDKIIARDPENATGFVPAALTQLGFADLVGRRPDDAIARFSAVIANFGDTAEARKCQLYLGDAYQLKDDADRAVAAYREVIAKYPDTAEAKEAQVKITRLTMFEETVEAFTQGPASAEGAPQ